MSPTEGRDVLKLHAQNIDISSFHQNAPTNGVYENTWFKKIVVATIPRYFRITLESDLVRLNLKYFFIEEGCSLQCEKYDLTRKKRPWFSEKKQINKSSLTLWYEDLLKIINHAESVDELVFENGDRQKSDETIEGTIDLRLVLTKLDCGHPNRQLKVIKLNILITVRYSDLRCLFSLVSPEHIREITIKQHKKEQIWDTIVESDHWENIKHATIKSGTVPIEYWKNLETVTILGEPVLSHVVVKSILGFLRTSQVTQEVCIKANEADDSFRIFYAAHRNKNNLHCIRRNGRVFDLEYCTVYNGPCNPRVHKLVIQRRN